MIGSNLIRLACRFVGNGRGPELCPNEGEASLHTAGSCRARKTGGPNTTEGKFPHTLTNRRLTYVLTKLLYFLVENKNYVPIMLFIVNCTIVIPNQGPQVEQYLLQVYMGGV